MPIYRGEGGSGTGSSGKPGGGTGGGGSTGPITTRDVLLTNPQRATLVTQEDANQYLNDTVTQINQEIVNINQEIEIIHNHGGGGGTSGPVKWSQVQDKPQTIMNLAGENASTTSLVSGGSF